MLSDRIKNLNLPVFGKVFALTANKDVIHLDGGSPDFSAPLEIKDAAIAAIRSDNNQYASVQGVLELRQSIAARIKEKEAVSFNPEEEIVICCGATEGITATLLTIVNPGDEVIILEPAFTLYAASVALCGGNPVYVQLQPPEFRIEQAAIEAALSPRTKAIIVNSPHNPTGRVYSKEELEIIAVICRKYNILIITDEVYDDIIYDGIITEKLWKLPDMKSRTIIVSSFSKSYSVTGWRVGYFILAEGSYFGWKDDWSLVRYLIDDIGVVALPLSGFYNNYCQRDGIFLRFAFCKQEKTLHAGIERLQQLKPKLK